MTANYPDELRWRPKIKGESAIYRPLPNWYRQEFRKLLIYFTPMKPDKRRKLHHNYDIRILMINGKYEIRTIINIITHLKISRVCRHVFFIQEIF